MKTLLEKITLTSASAEKLKDALPDESLLKEYAVSVSEKLKEIYNETVTLIEAGEKQKKEIRELKIRLGEENLFEEKNNVLFSHDGDGPFCPVCYNNRGRITRLRVENEKENSVSYACRVCGCSFNSH